MLGVQDFIGYYDWTFEYVRRKYGEEALREYWGKAIAFDSQQHALRRFKEKGLDGMYEYWSHTLEMEKAGYTMTRGENYLRTDMFACPSKGFLIKHGLEAYHDYCEHCTGWVIPLMEKVGFLVDHEHNHAGQCWSERYRPEDRPDHSSPPPIRGPNDVRNLENWQQERHHLYLGSKRVESEE